MKKFRSYARNNWKVVSVPRANLYKWESSDKPGDLLHYRDMVVWCYTHFPKNEWISRFYKDQSGNPVKKFAFKEDMYATLFMLKWS